MSESELFDAVVEHMRFIEQSADEERFEAPLTTKHLSFYAERLPFHFNIELKDFYEICNMSDDEIEQVVQEQVTYGVLTKLKRGYETVLARANEAELEEEEKLRHTPPDGRMYPMNYPLGRPKKEGVEAGEADSNLSNMPHPDPSPGDVVEEVSVDEELVRARGMPVLKWVDTHVEDVGSAIAVCSNNLEQLLKVMQRSNEEGATGNPIGPIHKAMMLTMLEVALKELTQPYVEERRISTLFQGFRDIVTSEGKKAVSKRVGDAMDAVIESGKDLAEKLMTAPGIEKLSDIPTETLDL